MMRFHFYPETHELQPGESVVIKKTDERDGVKCEMCFKCTGQDSIALDWLHIITPRGPIAEADLTHAVY